MRGAAYEKGARSGGQAPLRLRREGKSSAVPTATGDFERACGHRQEQHIGRLPWIWWCAKLPQFAQSRQAGFRPRAAGESKAF